MHRKALLGTAFGLVALSGAPFGALAGNLDPPVGPVAPSMKSLDTIEPWICINDLAGGPDSVHRITGPGNYFLRADVDAPAGKDAIEVAFGPGLGRTDIKLDLNGFSLHGGGGGSGSGIKVILISGPGGSSVAILGRGTRGTPGGVGAVVTGFAGDGISIDGAEHASVEGVTVTDCGGDGVTIAHCQFASLIDSFIHRTEDGVTVFSSGEFSLGGGAISDCAADGLRITSTEKVEVMFNPKEYSIKRCPGRGIALIDCPEADIFSLSVSQCAGHACYVEGSIDHFRMSHSSAVSCGGDAVHIRAGKVIELKGIGATNCNGDGIDITMDPSAPSARLQMADAAMHNNLGHGLRFTGGPGTVTLQISATNASRNGGSGCVIDANGAGGGGGGAGGLLIGLKDSIFDENTFDGMQVSRRQSIDSGMSLERVTLNRNGRHGLHDTFPVGDSPTGRNSASLTDCVINGNVVIGALIEGSSIFVEDSDTSNNGADGLKTAAHNAAMPIISKISAMVAGGNGGHGINLDCDSVELSGATCTDNGGNGMKFGAAPRSGSLSVVISGDARATALRNAAHGIEIECATADLSGLTCTDNGAAGLKVRKGGMVNGTINVNSGSALRNGWHGVHCEGDALTSLVMQGFVCTGNGFGTVPGDGVSLSGMRSIQARHGEFVGNAVNGLSISDFNSDALMDVVVCSANGGSGIVTSSSTGVPCGRMTMRSCVMDSNVGDGATVTCSTGGEISQCVATGNGGLGISVGAFGHVVVQNTCASNAGGPMFVPVPGNSVGPMVDEASIATNCNPNANRVR